MSEPVNPHLAAILGNGLSIAAEPTLNLASLTTEIRDRFAAAAHTGEPADKVLSRLALRAEPSSDPAQDFEALIGPLNHHKANVDDLRNLAELVGTTSSAVRRACTTLETFLQALQRLGRGHALDIIANRSVATFDHRDPVRDFLEAVITVAKDGTLVIGNLNYDCLALAALIDLLPSNSLCDMARGDAIDSFNIGSLPFEITGRLLRSSPDDFPSWRIKVKLMHLHGSLSFLRDPSTGMVHKFGIDMLRTADHWAAWRDGRTEWEPQVVLTNQSTKSQEIRKQPFALAYSVTREQLLLADRWLIAGYSFRDGCVNAMLRETFRQRGRAPQIMVVTYGASPTENEVLDALGWLDFFDPAPADFLHICRDGVGAAPTDPTWLRWSGVGRPPLFAIA